MSGSGEIRRIKTLAEDMALLTSLGDLVTIQIDLLNTGNTADLLKQEFNDSESIGLYIDDMILQRIIEGQFHDYYSIFEKIVEITGDYEAIDSVTALIRMEYQNSTVEVTVQLLGDHSPPQLMQITDHAHYFQLVQLIQARWQYAKSRGL